jgi:hypothetical protein
MGIKQFLLCATPPTFFKGFWWNFHRIFVITCPIVGFGRKYFCNSFLSNYLSQPLDIYYATLTRGPWILWDSISGLLLHIHFLFTDLVEFLTVVENFCNIKASWYLVYKCNQPFLFVTHLLYPLASVRLSRPSVSNLVSRAELKFHFAHNIQTS